jgi:hypothetical protein
MIGNSHVHRSVIPAWSEGPDPERRLYLKHVLETITCEVKPAITFAGP